MENPVSNVSSTSLATITSAEIDISIATAKKYPRVLSAFRQRAHEMATADVDVASSCFYKLRRKGKDGTITTIEGPSVRLAEIIASAWGNLRFGARIVGEEEGFVVAQGVAHDLESNVSTTVEVRRRITTSDGKRFGADMVMVTCNAACSIALRNAIFKAVPFTYAKSVYEAAKKTAVGDAKTLAERRQAMVAQFAKMNVPLDKILEYTEKATLEDIGLGDIEDLLGAYNAIKEGDATVDETFGSKVPETPKRASEVAAEAKKDAPAADPLAAPARTADDTAVKEGAAKVGEQSGAGVIAEPAGEPKPISAEELREKQGFPVDKDEEITKSFTDTVAKVLQGDGMAQITTNRNGVVLSTSRAHTALAAEVQKKGIRLDFKVDRTGDGAWMVSSLKKAEG